MTLFGRLGDLFGQSSAHTMEGEDSNAVMLVRLTKAESNLNISLNKYVLATNRTLGFRDRWMGAVSIATSVLQQAKSAEGKVKLQTRLDEARHFAGIYENAYNLTSTKKENLENSLAAVTEAKNQLVILDEQKRLWEEMGTSFSETKDAGFDPENIKRILDEANALIETTRESNEYV